MNQITHQLRIFLRQLLPALLLLTTFFSAAAQKNCPTNHPLFADPGNKKPEVVKNLGKAPQYYPLQYVKDKTTFMNKLKDPGAWKGKKNPKRYAELNDILKLIGFEDGAQSASLTDERVSFETIPYGTRGNLGGAGKGNTRYIYAVLLPANGSINGIDAWKITGPNGCFVYICLACGNAFYPTECRDNIITEPCKDAPITITFAPVEKDTGNSFTVKKCTYLICKNKKSDQQQQQGNGRRRSIAYDTTLISCEDITIRTSRIKYMVSAEDYNGTISTCDGKPVNITIEPKLQVVGARINETTVIPVYKYCNCTEKWELTLNGGISHNNAPRMDNESIATRTSPPSFSGELSLAYRFSNSFQLGLSAGYLTIRYQDDSLYPKPVAGTYDLYSDVILAKPLVPVQLFGKISFGNTIGWRANLLLSAGYAFASDGSITNNSTDLNIDPGVSGGLTAGIGFGVDYFFSCRFGLGADIKGQYFSLNGDAQNYNIFALPATIGLKFRL